MNQSIPDSKTASLEESMTLVIVGHVDHGKSTLLGRLLVDTGSVSESKVETVRRFCREHARPFEYAYLLDALADEQAQGITIDTARIFFSSAKRNYIISDAPGHIEFLKNMITGAARAEAALLLIDAAEGIAENSRRHGYLLSMLGIRQVLVVINKMDLSGYSRQRYEEIRSAYGDFLQQIGVSALDYIPASAMQGENIVSASGQMPWYQGPFLLQAIDALQNGKLKSEQNFRMPVQDIYRFSEMGDDRRIVAGTVASGELSVGDEVVFYPSGKRSVIASVEGFQTANRQTISAGMSTGVTLRDELYIKPGEIMARAGQSRPLQGQRFVANIFWLGKTPLRKGKRYRLKMLTMRSEVSLEKLEKVLDAATLEASSNRVDVRANEVARVELRTRNPLAFELFENSAEAGRFVIVDGTDIAGGGIILAAAGEIIAGTRQDFDPWQMEQELHAFARRWFPHWWEESPKEEAQSSRLGI